jgi:protein TonB
MDAVRSAFIWTGVGVSHVALLVAAWGFGLDHSSASEGWLAVALIDSAEPKRVVSLPVEVSVVSAGTTLPEVPFIKVTKTPATATTASQTALPATPQSSRGIEVEPPRFNFRAEPMYPRAARLAGREGKVCIQLEISSNGTLHRATVTLSSGDLTLDRAAVEAAERSTYYPAASVEGPLEASAEATYRFVLR